MPAPPGGPLTKAPRPRRRWLPRLGLGLAAALLILGGAEGAARLALGNPPERPVVATRWSGDEVLVPRGDLLVPAFQGEYAIPPFAPEPAPGTLRLVVLGGSSVHGGGLPAEEEFAARLGDLLAAGGATVEALNLGRPALDSRSLVRVAEALGEHGVRAHLAVVYLGHNDLGNRTQEANWARSSAAVARLGRLLDGLRLTYELRQLVWSRAARGAKPTHRSALPALSEEERAAAADELRANLGTITASLRETGARVVLVPAISDVWTYGPLGVDCPEAMPAGTARVERVRVTYDPAATTLDEVERALASAPGCAALLHLRGRLRLEAGDRGGHADLLAARDRDPVAMRATSQVHAVIRDAAREGGAALVDLPAHVRSTRGSAPPEWFVDEAHLHPRGHIAVAEVIAPQLAPLLVTLRPGG